MLPEVTISGEEGKIHDWQALKAQLLHQPKIVAMAPYVSSQGILSANGQVVPVLLTGIVPAEERAISHLEDKIRLGSATNLQHFGILLGRSLAENLGVSLGEFVTVMIPQASVSPMGVVPRFKRFVVRGIFSAGAGFNFDTKMAFIDMGDAQKLLQMAPQDVSGLRLKVNDIYQAPQLAQSLRVQLGNGVQIGDWSESYGAFFDAVKMEKTMMFMILLLIVGVAAFNLVSSLVMVVNDKQAEIAILRTLGATPKTILSIFIVQGMLIGSFGTLLGVILGLILASHATEWVNTLQNVFDWHVLSSSIYFVDYLPSKILGSDIVVVTLTALTLSFLATLYPAWRASKTVIAEALHYE